MRIWKDYAANLLSFVIKKKIPDQHKTQKSNTEAS